jgi:hypothetical protein
MIGKSSVLGVCVCVCVCVSKRLVYMVGLLRNLVHPYEYRKIITSIRMIVLDKKT